ncbi:hypothetical protein GCM10018963_74470 [Saccharothrix longispora]
MRHIDQHEAETMRNALKEIASYGNLGADQASGGQSAARRAREVLEELGLFFESDAKGN